VGGQVKHEEQLDTTAKRDRVAWVLEYLHGNNQRRMAEEYGLSQAAVSRAVRGQQEVSPRFLAALAEDPRINRQWLFTGKGEPLQATDQSGVAMGIALSLPVATTILPGPPDQHPLLLEGTQYPVAQFFYRLSRYFLKVTEGSSITRAEGWGVMPGDLLLMESDNRLWRDDESILNGTLCVVSRRDKDGVRYVITTIRWDQTSRRLEFMSAEAVIVPPPSPLPDRRRRPHEILRYELYRVKTVIGPREGAEAANKSEWVPVPSTDIVALVILLVRNWLPGRAW
jgi:transcriptional regulator with XRE-family HTH domain